MAIMLPIENGVVSPNSSAAGDKTDSASSQSQLEKNKDMFLQLLVAEMQYQDPLEPTDNSEYIQQLYSMSQTESILAVQDNVQDMSANALVGQYVTVMDPTSGEKVTGKVDFITEQGGVKMLSIEGNTYDVGTVVQVHDQKYYEAVTNASKLTEMVQNLPSLGSLRLKDKEAVEEALNLLSQMDEYQQGFVNEDIMDALAQAYNRMLDLVKSQESASTDTNPGTSGENQKDEAAESQETIHNE